MKISHETGDAQRSGDFEEVQYKVSHNPVAFDFLSSKLYADDVAAVIRELGTNARDAHIMNGNSGEPFLVHLPSMIEPYFFVRDYGISMTHEQVLTVYTTYFESLNRESDDTNGGFGLGSKTPFAYTDMFTVTVILDGEKHVYGNFKENGVPRLALLTKTDTTERNGVEVRMDVKPTDFQRFQQAANEIYRYFKVQPKVIGAKTNYAKAEPFLSGDDWKLFTVGYSSFNRSPGYGPTLKVIMGDVCYPCNSNKVTPFFSAGYRIEIEMPVGSCRPTISREELRDDEDGVKAIQGRLREIEQEVKDKIEELIGECDCLLERHYKSQKYRELCKTPLVDIDTKSWDFHSYRLHGNSLRYNGTPWGLPRVDDHFIIPDGNPKELSQKDKSKLRYYCNQNSITRFLIIQTDKEAEFLKTFGKFVKLSDLSSPPRQSSKRTPHKGFIKQYKKPYETRAADRWTTVPDNEIDDKAYCLPRVGYSVKWRGELTDPRRVYELAKIVGITVIYGIPEKKYDKLREKLEIDELEPRLIKLVQAKLNAMSTEDRMAWYNMIDRRLPKKFLDLIDGLSPECDNVVKAARYQAPGRQILSSQVYMCGLKEPAKPQDPMVAFKKKYPLVPFITLTGDSINHAVEYIKLLEKK